MSEDATPSAGEDLARQRSLATAPISTAASAAGAAGWLLGAANNKKRFPLLPTEENTGDDGGGGGGESENGGGGGGDPAKKAVFFACSLTVAPQLGNDQRVRQLQHAVGGLVQVKPTGAGHANFGKWTWGLLAEVTDSAATVKYGSHQRVVPLDATWTRIVRRPVRLRSSALVYSTSEREWVTAHLLKVSAEEAELVYGQRTKYVPLGDIRRDPKQVLRAKPGADWKVDAATDLQALKKRAKVFPDPAVAGMPTRFPGFSRSALSRTQCAAAGGGAALLAAQGAVPRAQAAPLRGRGLPARAARGGGGGNARARPGGADGARPRPGRGHDPHHPGEEGAGAAAGAASRPVGACLPAASDIIVRSTASCSCEGDAPAWGGAGWGEGLRVRVEIMGLGKYEHVGESQPVLMMINPIISTRTRSNRGVLTLTVVLRRRPAAAACSRRTVRVQAAGRVCADVGAAAAGAHGDGPHGDTRRAREKAGRRRHLGIWQCSCVQWWYYLGGPLSTGISLDRQRLR
jgi:hypothetical protein